MENFLRSYFAAAYQVFAHPFTLKWERGLRIYISCNKKSKHCLVWRLSYVLHFIYLITLIYLMITHINQYTSSDDYVGVVFHGLWIICTGSLVVNHTPIFFLGEDIIKFVSGNVNLIKHFELDKFTFGSGAFEKSEKIRKWVVGGLGISCFAMQCFILTPILLMFQHQSWQLGSHFSRLVLWIAPDYNMLAIIIGLAVDHWHLNVIQGPGVLLIQINMSFMHTFKTCIGKILNRQLKTPPANVAASLRCLQEDMRIYSKLRILSNLYNNIFGALYVFPFKVILTFFLVMMVTITVTVAGQGGDLFLLLFGFVCTFVCTVFAITFTTFMAMVNEYSVKLRKNLMTRRECQATCLGRRLVNSFKVEAVWTGSFYGIQRISCLTLLGLTSNLTGSILIYI